MMLSKSFVIAVVISLVVLFFASSAASVSDSMASSSDANNLVVPTGSGNDPREEVVIIDKADAVVGSKQSDDSSVEIVDGGPEDENEEQQNPLIEILMSRKKEVSNLAHRQGHLMDLFRAGKKVLFLPEMLNGPQSDMIDELFKSLKATCKNQKEVWMSQCIAEKLVLFEELADENDKIAKEHKKRASRSGTEAAPVSAAVVKFKSHMKKAMGQLDADLESSKAKGGASGRRAGGKNSSRPRKRKFGVQSGIPVQERMQWDEKSRDKLPCPACNHHFCVIVDNDGQDGDASANAENRHRGDGLRDLADEWNDTSAKNCTKKPTLNDGTVSAQIVCMCVMMNCSNRVDGVGCVVCEDFGRNADRPEFDSVTQ